MELFYEQTPTSRFTMILFPKFLTENNQGNLSDANFLKNLGHNKNKQQIVE